MVSLGKCGVFLKKKFRSHVCHSTVSTGRRCAVPKWLIIIPGPSLVGLWLTGSSLDSVAQHTTERLPYVLMELELSLLPWGVWFWDLVLLAGAAKSHISWDSEARSDDWSVWAEAQAGWHGEGAERTGGEAEKSRGECDTLNSRGTHSVLSWDQGKEF